MSSYHHLTSGATTEKVPTTLSTMRAIRHLPNPVEISIAKPPDNFKDSFYPGKSSQHLTDACHNHDVEGTRKGLDHLFTTLTCKIRNHSKGPAIIVDATSTIHRRVPFRDHSDVANYVESE
ncbi:hypothetical protein FRC03_005019 [Tulasnella sp. 419]|nr:hypothetical protein FRC03_005019 [Tulasnella sp. 419]